MTKARRGKARIEVKKKEFTFRGKTIEELKPLSIEEIAKVMPSRIRRSIRRGLSDDHMKLIKRAGKTTKEKVLRTHLRDMPIFPIFVGRTFAIHSGKEWKRVDIHADMVGHYLGEFAPTRKGVKHTGPGVGATRSSKFMPLK